MSLYWNLIRIRIKSMTEYQGAFWAHFFAKMVGWGANLAIVFLLVNQFDNIAGWSAYEVLLLFSINETSYAFAGFLMYGPFTAMSHHINRGTFDDALTRPVNIFLYMCCREFNFGYIGNLASTLVALGISLHYVGFAFSFVNVLYLLMTLIGAFLIQCSLFMFANVPCFWMVKVDSLQNLKGNLSDFIQYPISIYQRWIQILLIFVFPVAFISFFPVQTFLHKTDFVGLSPIVCYLSPLVGALLFFLGYRFFLFGIKNYKSTGS